MAPRTSLLALPDLRGEREARRNRHAAAQRVEHDAVFLRAAQEALGALAPDILGNGDPGVAPDRGQPDWIIAYCERATSVPLRLDLHLERLELDPHVRGHHPQRRPLTSPLPTTPGWAAAPPEQA